MNQRTEFVLKSFHTSNFRALCAGFGISPKTGYKWQKRFLKNGPAGLEEWSRRPLSHAKELGEAVVCEIIRLKTKHAFWGPRKLREVYGRTHAEVPSESSFKRVLDRVGLVEHRRLKRSSQAGRICTGRQAKAPNEVWTVDFKGWWYKGNGERCEPLTVRDEFSRYLLELRAVENARWKTIRGCFEPLFDLHGLPDAIRSDNGPPFASTTGVLGLSRLSAWWVALGIDLERSRPGCPQDNPAHERLHRDVEAELRGQQQQASFEVWRREFNEERPHEALGMKRPAQVYTPSTRKFAGTPEDLSYPNMEARRVQQTGHIHHGKDSVFISSALAGWSVGLEACAAGKFNVHFARLLLGQYDKSTASFTRTQDALGLNERVDA